MAQVARTLGRGGQRLAVRRSRPLLLAGLANPAEEIRQNQFYKEFNLFVHLMRKKIGNLM
jgi:hypothetical protein